MTEFFAKYGEIRMPGVGDAHVRQVQALSDLGQQAMENVSVERLLDSAIALAADGLDVEHAVICEVVRLNQLRIVNGLGWTRSCVGSFVPGGLGSACGFAIFSDAPVIVRDFRSETRFMQMAPLLEAGIISGISVIIRAGGRAHGTLAVQDTRQRSFTLRDVNFLQCIAHTLGGAIERARIEDDLRRLNRDYRTLTESLPQLLWTASPAGELIHVSAQCSDYTGLPPEALLGYRWVEVLHPDDLSPFREAFDTALGSGENLDVEARIRRYDGAYRWFKIGAVPVRDDDGVITKWFGSDTDIHDIVLARDAQARSNEELERLVASRTDELAEANNRLIVEMSEREHAEQALRHAQKLESLGELTGGIAHDFNNLLTVIIGNLELVRSKITDPFAEHQLLGALSAANRGEKLTNQLLAFSRRQRLKREVIDLKATVEAMGDLLKRAASDHIRIELQLSDYPVVCETDVSQMQSAIFNLVLNAKDALAGKPGERLIVIAVAAVDFALRGDGHIASYAKLSVTDNGVGMDAATARQAFEPFFTTKDVGQGSGLGLSQVYGFAEQSDGRAMIDSMPGKGTTVSILLPLSSKPLTTQQVRSPDIAPESTQTVLIVEDDKGVRDMAMSAIRDLGYAVIVAEDGPMAIGILKQQARKIDILFTDVVMPGGMNGFDVAREALRLNADMRVVFTSGYAESIGVREQNFVGATILSKPYRPLELARELRHAAHVEMR